jgi:SprT-like family
LTWTSQVDQRRIRRKSDCRRSPTYLGEVGNRRRPRAKPDPCGRNPGYFAVAGLDLHDEMERLRALPVFSAGRLAKKVPRLQVRRARRQPTRLGFANPSEWRLSVTAYPGIRVGDIQETLLHELVHLHVGTERGHRRWHGRKFKQTLRRAMAEAYGVTGVDPPNALHGAYAEALERRRLKSLSATHDHRQLELPIAV